MNVQRGLKRLLAVLCGVYWLCAGIAVFEAYQHGEAAYEATRLSGLTHTQCLAAHDKQNKAVAAENAMHPNGPKGYSDDDLGWTCDDDEARAATPALRPWSVAVDMLKSWAIAFAIIGTVGLVLRWIYRGFVAKADSK